jgi:nucleoside-diphosphate-sugar epimerase
MSKKKKKIAILGCGWVGNALKEKLESNNDEVNCLCRDVNMDTLVGFYACDALIIAIPPSDEYLDVIEDVYFSLSLNEALDTQVIFLSSTSFYDDKKIIIEAEELAKIKDPDTVILRLGGLMGYDRIAGKYTAGENIEDSPTNYVHRDDVVGIIERVIETRVKDKIFNIVAPIQSTKKEIFTQNAKQFGFEATYFSENISKNKSFSSDILCDVLGYSFKKEDVKTFWN